MFKRMISASLVLIMLLSLAAFPVSADIELPEIPVKPGGCAAGDHDWNDWTYIGDGEHQRDCKNGDAIEVDPCEETVSVEKAPTPLAPGLERHRCNICGNTYTVELAILPTPALTLSQAANALPGQEVTLELRLQNNCGIAGMQLALTYDKEVLTFVEAKAGEVLAGALISSNGGEGRVLLNFAADTNLTADGVLATLTFKLDPMTPAGTYPVTLALVEAIDEAEQPVAGIEVAGGGVTVYPSVPMDINRDGKISVLDAILLYRYLAGEITENELDLRAADLDESRTVDSADAILLMQYLLEH